MCVLIACSCAPVAAVVVKFNVLDCLTMGEMVAIIAITSQIAERYADVIDWWRTSEHQCI